MNFARIFIQIRMMVCPPKGWRISHANTSFQQNTGFNTGALIKRNQLREADHDAIRSAVRAGQQLKGRTLCRPTSSMSGDSRAARRSHFMISAVPDRSFFATGQPCRV